MLCEAGCGPPFFWCSNKVTTMSRAKEMQGPGLCIAMLLTYLPGVAIPPVAAAEANANFATCAAERDDRRRLACYDAEVARFKGEAAVETSAGKPEHTDPATREGSQPPEQEPGSAADDFGMTPALARSKTDKSGGPEERKALAAVVVRIDEKPYGERILYLDNGQIWEENSRNRNLPLAVGDEITVKSAAFGSYKLIGPGGKRFTRVRRTG